MSQRAITALQGILRPHLDLSKSRVETLCLIVVGMVSARTVNLGHIACERPGATLIASTYRRLQRFFQHVRLGQDWAVPLVVELLGLSGSWYLALDRTTWKVGTRDVNYLVLAAVTRRFRVPLLWSLLPGPGNSSSAARIALVERYLAHFAPATIRLLIADREFIGADWIKFLNDNNIPFAIRLREDRFAGGEPPVRRVTDEAGHDLTLRARLHLARRTRTFRARLGARDDAATRDAPLLNFAAKRLKDEWLIVVSNVAPRTALAAYRKRWAIECLFGDAKSRGLNIEDTRLSDPRKLHLLMALVALALAWAGRTAATVLGPRAPERKAHGYFAKSWFRIGFDRIRNLLRTEPRAAVDAWLRLPAKPLKTRRVV